MYVAAGFGLIHGLAFATVLANLNLSAGPMALSILGFNIGIEVMQLMVMLLIVPWLIILSTFAVYKYVRVGGAVLAALAAIGWIIQRGTGESNMIAAAIEKLLQYAPWAIVGLAVVSLLFLLMKKKGRLEGNF
jgi:hypothetical protein